MKTLFTRTAIILLTVATAWQSSAFAETQATSLTVYSDVAGADEILTRNYAQALEEMLNERGENQIFLQNNLCVHYLLTRELSKAEDSCKQALRESKRSRNYGEWWERSQVTHIRRQYRERALRHLNTLHTLKSNKLAANNGKN